MQASIQALAKAKQSCRVMCTCISIGCIALSACVSWKAAQVSNPQLVHFVLPAVIWLWVAWVPYALHKWCQRLSLEQAKRYGFIRGHVA